MHHIYHTEGIILGSRSHGEAGKYFFIFTRDLGMIYASASGVRKMSSKLRYILQDFAYVKVDLVQGKNIFRVTSASKTNMLGEITKKPENFKIFYNIAQLLRRLLAGVEPNSELFDDLLRGLILLEKTVSKTDLQNIEVVLVLRILNNLGYIGDHDALGELTRLPFEEDMLGAVSKWRSQALSHINKALKETHL